MTRCNVLIAHQNQLFREGLRNFLPKARFAVVGEGRDLAEAVRHAGGEPADLAILALEPGCGVEATLAQVALSRRTLPLVKLVVLAASFSAAEFMRTMRSGVDAILTTSMSSDVLRTSLDLILQNQRVFLAPADFLPAGAAPVLEEEAAAEPRGRRSERWDADEASNLVPFAPLRPVGGEGAAHAVAPVPAAPIPMAAAPAELLAPPLSEREEQILRCLVKGLSNKAIARELNVAETTVKVHVKGLMRKVRAANRTQVAIWAMHHCPPPGDAAPRTVSLGRRAGLAAGPANQSWSA